MWEYLMEEGEIMMRVPDSSQCCLIYITRDDSLKYNEFHLKRNIFYGKSDRMEEQVSQASCIISILGGIQNQSEDGQLCFEQVCWTGQSHLHHSLFL